MKKNIFNLFAAGIVLSLAACNNSSDNTGANGDSANLNQDSLNAASASANSSNDYSAYADSVERNSQAGYYLNPRTGKPLKVKVNRTTGELTDQETNEPVWRYVDNRNWWVYGIDDSDWHWDTMGQARMENDKLMYQGDNGKWMSYDEQWKTQDEKVNKSWKEKVGDTKIKVSKDGDIKIKDEHGKVKYDADDNKIKVDSSKK